MARIDIENIISQGEGQRIEFKESFSEDNEAIVSLCAFANAQGGTVLLGVTNDSIPKGVQLGKNTIENFTNKLRRETEPPISAAIEEFIFNGKTIVYVNVLQANKGEVFFAFNKPYIRVGKTNQPMSSAEIRSRLQNSNVKSPSKELAEIKLKQIQESKDIYCTRCGVKAGESSYCLSINGHDFQSFTGNVYCTRCGVKAGESSYCKNINGHDFQSFAGDVLFTL